MFPDLERVSNWYIVSLDGLQHLKTALHSSKRTSISDSTMEQIGGMTAAEWTTFCHAQQDDHEMFASLALLAACEGGIRRDLAWRGGVNDGQQHYAHFKPLADEQHVSIARIIDAWQASLGQRHHFRKQITQLRGLYSDRNVLAHGRSTLGQFSFSLIFEKLCRIREKWKDVAPDFKGF